MISIYTLTSALHDEKAVSAVTGEFLGSLGIEYDFKGEDYSDYGSSDLDLIYVRTGGTEGVFKPLLPKIKGASSQPVYLLTSGKNNSLAASLEILSYLRSNNLKGEIIHGSPRQIKERVTFLLAVEKARKELSGKRYGVVGAPSDWLIASGADYDAVKSRLGIELVDIPMEELLSEIESTSPDSLSARIACGEPLYDASPEVKDAVPGAYRIYTALKSIVKRHSLSGFTLRCFDLLSSVRNTGCLALSLLNSEGIVAGCEGDVPAMLSMAISKAVTGVSGFQANPAYIDTESGEILLAHCTIPLNMVKRYSFDTHFESGIGVGIHGHMQEGDVTLFKISGDAGRYFVAEGALLRNQYKGDLCRTQIVVNVGQTEYFLKNPIGNHHIVIPGHVRTVIEALLA